MLAGIDSSGKEYNNVAYAAKTRFFNSIDPDYACLQFDATFCFLRERTAYRYTESAHGIVHASRAHCDTDGFSNTDRNLHRNTYSLGDSDVVALEYARRKKPHGRSKCAALELPLWARS